MSGLRQAYELIKDENRWTQGASGRDQYNRFVGSLDPAAVKWCAAGAVTKCFATIHGDRLNRIAKELFPQYAELDGYDAILRVNDEQGHEAILSVFEKAIVEIEGSL